MYDYRHEVIAEANALTNGAGLPSYSELVEALRGFESLVCSPSSPQRAKALSAQADKARAIMRAINGDKQ